MPSRPGVALVLVFWLAVTAYVVRQEVLPRFFGDTPPQIGIDLVDELSSAPTQWTIYRSDADGGGEQKIGTMTSRIEYVPADDTFRFLTSYRGLKYEVLGQAVSVEVPSGGITIRVDRDGRLREQSMSGKFEVRLRGVSVAVAETEASGVVRDGVLTGKAKLVVPGVFDRPIEEELTPVPAGDGKVMNPMMPVDRLRGVVPGHRWVIRQSNPMEESLVALLRGVLAKNNLNSKLIPDMGAGDELLAEVQSEPVQLTRDGGSVACWVIRYETADKLRTARTYVRRDNGQVLRQEADGFGNRFRIDRDE